MTCVVTDGKAMAADSRTTNADGLILTDAAEKLFLAPDGSVVGYAGEAGSGLLVREWFEKGADTECYPGNLSDDFEVLILRPDGVVEWMDRRCARVPFAVPTAIGAGAGLALGALRVGADLKWAVEVAIKRNAHCGGPVRLLEPRKERTVDASA